MTKSSTEQIVHTLSYKRRIGNCLLLQARFGFSSLCYPVSMIDFRARISQLLFSFLLLSSRQYRLEVLSEEFIVQPGLVLLLFQSDQAPLFLLHLRALLHFQIYWLILFLVITISFQNFSHFLTLEVSCGIQVEECFFSLLA